MSLTIENERLLDGSAPFNMPRILWSLLVRRGYDTEEKIADFLSPSLKDLTHPFQLDGMEAACNRLVQAFHNQEKICIYGDFDLDGSSGVALLNDGFSQLGFQDLILYQPKRLTEGYGFHAEVVEKMQKLGVTLIVTIDVGITAIEAVEKTNSLGIDVIITDHHLPKETLPAALAVINPNKGFCESGLGHLCGCGVGFYLIMGLKIRLTEAGLLKSEMDLKSLLDLFTIGTLTDMVPLVAENRSLVRHGLRQLKRTKRPGLKALIEGVKLKDKPEFSSQDIGFTIAPKLNALSRLETHILPLDVFKEEDEAKAKSVVSEVLETNSLRKKLQNLAQEEANEVAIGQSDQNFIYCHSKDFHQGVVGLVATRLAQSNQKPSFVGAEKDGKIVASGRLPEGYQGSLLDALEFSSEHLIEFGGHAPAAGLKFKPENSSLIYKSLKEFYSQADTEVLGGESVNTDYDLSVTLEDFSPDYLSWFKKLEPFGVGFKEPIYQVTDVSVQSFREMKGGHLRLTLNSSLTHKIMTAVWFSPSKSPEEVNDLIGAPVEFIVQAQSNFFAGRETLQLLVKSLKVI